MNIQELVTTALDATKSIEARQAAYRVLDRMDINKLPIDADTKLALLWAAILDDLEPAMKRQARFKAQERPTPQTQEPPATPRQPEEVLPSVPAGKELPEVPCNAFPDIFTAYRPATSRVHPSDEQIW